jgi:hypothetical protein
MFRILVLRSSWSDEKTFGKPAQVPWLTRVSSVYFGHRQTRCAAIYNERYMEKTRTIEKSKSFAQYLERERL